MEPALGVHRAAVQPPSPASATAAGLADPEIIRLGNGALVVSLDLPQAPLVCLDLWCRAGSSSESGSEHGMAHFLEHMVFKGSRSLGAGEFDRRIEALGGTSNAATGFDDVHYHVLMPPEGAAEALELLLELVLAPRLDADDFQMERQVVLEELAQSEDQPEEQAIQRLLARACGNHPYGLPILGSRASLLAQDPEAMAAFHRRRYGGGGCVLAISGPLQGLELLARASESSLANLPPLVVDSAAAALQLHRGEERLSLPRLESARLLMAWAMPPATALEAVAGADLATTVLAEGRRSRLVQRLREELQLVESIDLDLHVLESGSLALLEAVCAPEQLPAVRSAINQVWQELGERHLGEAEWQRAERLVSNGYRFGLEAAAGLAGLIGSNALWNRPRSLAAPLQAIASWTPARMAEEMLPRLDPAQAFLLEVVPA